MSRAFASTADDAQLAQTGQLVDDLTDQLSSSYTQLQRQVARLARELSESRHRHVRELQDKERLANRLFQVLEALPAAVVVIDEKDRIDQFNPVAEALFPAIGWGRLWSQVFHEQVLMQTASNEWQLQDGRFVSVSQKSLAPDPGKILVVVDVTDSRALQEQLNRQQRLAEMGEMAAQLAHQVRTPVASALLYSEHLGRHDLQPAQRQRFSERLKLSLQHTENQVRELLSFARGGHFEPARVNLSNLVGELEDSVEALLQANQATLTVADQSDGQAVVMGSADAILGALRNLVENAVRHGGEGVTIELQLTPVDDGYCLRLVDDGKGIATELREQIFNPFFTTSSDGTGLGLAVVQNVVLSHGGAIRLLEHGLAGRGTGFVICLPSMPALDSESATAPAGQENDDD